MRISALPLLIAGAGLAMQANASPIRVVVVSSHQEITAKPANAGVAQVARPATISITSTSTGAPTDGDRRKHACIGAMLRNKAFRLSNAFRHALGLAPIEANPHAAAGEDKKVHGGLVHIMPMPFIGTPVNAGEEHAPVPHHHGHKVHHHGHHRGSFLRRVHHALMALGPWEGRAVAFVLGCGIGVLLRMVWVMAVVTYRVLRGSRDEDEAEYAAIVFENEHDAEDLIVPPPQYTDEKVALAAEEIRA